MDSNLINDDDLEAGVYKVAYSTHFVLIHRSLVKEIKLKKVGMGSWIHPCLKVFNLSCPCNEL